MNNYSLTKGKGGFKTFMRLSLACFCTIWFGQTLTGQNCDKKTSVFFDSDHYDIRAGEDERLVALTKNFAQKTDSFMLEIHAFTDSMASTEYNYKLADNRLKTVVAYLKKNSLCYFEIKEKVRGEALPSGSNGTEEGRAQNRRVDIFYWKLKNGKITLKGKGGSEIDFDRNYFEPCGICETSPKMTEVSTNDEASRRGIAMATTEGDQLITGGMVGMEFTNCAERNKKVGNKPWHCSEVTIRIPAATYDEELEIWTQNGSDPRWSRDKDAQLQYDAKNKCYIMKVFNFCPGGCGNGGSMCNLDKPIYNGYIAIPGLNRTKGGTYVNGVKSRRNLESKRHNDTMWKFVYRDKAPLFFTDSGMAKNKIGYVFSGEINRYERDCSTSTIPLIGATWCFEIPIDAYTKIIYFQKKKKYRLKVPRKYKNYTPRLFIPAADTLLPLTRLEGSDRKYTFQLPVPDTYVVIYSEKNNPDNKRAYDGHIDLSKVHARYSKRHKYYKARLKRRQIKKAISANS